jgi:hypothetical protein
LKGVVALKRLLYHWCPTLFLLTNYKQFINYTIMEPKTMSWSVSDQLQEPRAGSSLGFRRQENEYDAAQDESETGTWYLFHSGRNAEAAEGMENAVVIHSV